MRENQYQTALRSLVKMLQTERGRDLDLDTVPWCDDKGTWYATVIEKTLKHRSNSRGQLVGRLHAPRVYSLRFDTSKRYWRFVSNTRPHTHARRTVRVRPVEPHAGMSDRELERHLLTCTDLKCRLWAVHRYVEELQESARFGDTSPYLTAKRYANVKLTDATKTRLFEIYLRCYEKLPVRSAKVTSTRDIKRHARPRREGSMSRIHLVPSWMRQKD